MDGKRVDLGTDEGPERHSRDSDDDDLYDGQIDSDLDVQTDSDLDPTDSDLETDNHSELIRKERIQTLLRRALSAIDGGFLRFSTITPQVFQSFDRQLDGRGRITYFGNSGILLVKMALPKHEKTVVTLSDGFRNQLVDMDLDDHISRIGIPRFHSVRQNAAYKEPDDGFTPSWTDLLVTISPLPTFSSQGQGLVVRKFRRAS